jgi:hypothetical protein
MEPAGQRKKYRQTNRNWQSDDGLARPGQPLTVADASTRRGKKYSARAPKTVRLRDAPPPAPAKHLKFKVHP